MLLVFGITLVVSAGANAVEPVSIGGITIEKTIYTGDFFEPGDTIPYRYAVSSHEPYVNVVVTDDKCSPVEEIFQPGSTTLNIGDTGGSNPTLANNDVLNGGAGEVWQFKCDDPAPAISGATLVNTATVTANLGTETGAVEFDTDTTTLYGFTLRKQVGLYNDGLYPDFNGFPDNTAFAMQMYKCTGTPLVCDLKDTFTISEQSPKYFWFTSGTWKFVEVDLPLGYVPVDWMTNGFTWATGQTPADNDQTYLNVTWSGCSLGHWKNTEVWPYPYQHETLLEPPFDGLVDALKDDTFIEALNYGGGPGVRGGQMILLRQAVAALLNETVYGSAFGPYLTTDDLIDAVNEALGSGDKTTMTTLAGTLDWWNNGICRDVTATSTACPTIAGTYHSNFFWDWPTMGEDFEQCDIPSDVTIYGNVLSDDILVRVFGTVNGNITQLGVPGWGGVDVMLGGTVNGDIDEWGPQGINIRGTVTGNVTENDDGDLHVYSTGIINGTATENGNGSLILDPGGQIIP
jgi:hypothetical protein